MQMTYAAESTPHFLQSSDHIQQPRQTNRSISIVRYSYAR